MLLLKILAIVAVIGSVAWVIASPGYEPALAVVVALGTLISLFIVEKKQSRARQQQTVSRSSIGIQGGRDVSIGDIDTENRVN